MNVGSLFSGIGGIDLGLERAGMDVSWFCEIDPFCQRVLAKHWPSVPCYPDITKLYAVDVKPVDVLCGGFPCQDVSLANRGNGLAGSRSGLWFEFARLIGDLRPRWVVVENVPGLKTRGLGKVLGEMAALGYDAEWDCLPASAFGAPHKRDRIWIVAYPTGTRLERGRPTQSSWSCGAGAAAGLESYGSNWSMQPGVSGVGYGLPDWVDRIRSLGNAAVPQIAQWIGERILEWEQR